MSASGSSARTESTRATVLAAAVEEFATFGYRRSSVDSVSRRAGISRATLYLHWSSKEQLFRALVEQLHEQHLLAMQAVLDSPAQRLEESLVAILEARFGRFVQLTSTSPNAAELYDVHDRVCGDIAAAATQRAQALVVQLLHRAVDSGQARPAGSGLTIEQVADVLLTCAHAAKGEDPASATPAAYRDRLDQLVRLLVNGLGPTRR